MDLNGKRAFVTGGAGGIGGAISRTLRDAGAEVTATVLNEDEAARAAADASLAGIALVVLDIRSDPAVIAAAQAQEPTDILVNCAGTTMRGPAAFGEDGFDLVVDINLNGSMRCARAFHPTLAQRQGCIINIASVMSTFGSGTAPGYAASKGGVVQLTKSLAIAWAPDNIRVNAIAPGWIVTPLTDAQIDDALRQRVIARTPMARWGDPQFIGDAALFLSSSRASFITGITLPVDGGYTAV